MRIRRPGVNVIMLVAMALGIGAGAQLFAILTGG